MLHSRPGSVCSLYMCGDVPNAQTLQEILVYLLRTRAFDLFL